MTNAHYAIKDVSQHATVWFCSKNNTEILVTTGDDQCDSCLGSLDGEVKTDAQ